MKLMIPKMVEFLEERVRLLSFHPLAFLPLLFFLFFLYKLSFTSPALRKNLPPSPPRLPIIGNLHQMRNSSPHRSLKALSQKYGEIMLLHFGSKPTVVVSSKEMASLVLKTFDSSLIGRPKISSGKHIFYNYKDLVFSTYGEHWRHLRSICVLNLLSNNRVKSFRAVREEEVALMIEKIKKSSMVNLTQLFFLLSNHVICKTAFGRVYDGEEGGANFDKLLVDTISLLGNKNIKDIFPRMGWINWFNGVNANLSKISKGFDVVMERIIQEHEDSAKQNGDNSEKNETSMKDFVDLLLEIQRSNLTKNVTLDKETIKGVILDMFIGGTHTGQTALEWTFTELMRHPRVMKRLQEEVRGILGGKEAIAEEDVEKMAYLKAVIKESFRVHPPAPLPIPRECIEQVKLKGYNIPVGTQIIINFWAIARDPAYWEEPEEFVPERFLDSPIDYRGQHFEFLPFGGGRRGCPGISFAVASIELALANLVYRFDWSLPKGGETESLDISETKGSLAHKRTPLTLVATPWIAQ